MNTDAGLRRRNRGRADAAPADPAMGSHHSPRRSSGTASATPVRPVRGRLRAFTRGGCEPPGANVAAPVLASPGRSSRPALHRNGRFSGSSGGKRRPEPHGHKSFRPSFSMSSVSMPTIRLPRLTRDSLEGTPGGACQTAQKDASVSWSRYMIVLPGRSGQEDRSRCGAGAASRFLRDRPVRRAFPLCQAAHKAERAEYRLEATHVAPCPRQLSTFT
jgi:hypothetical protein